MLTEHSVCLNLTETRSFDSLQIGCDIKNLQSHTLSWLTHRTHTQGCKHAHTLKHMYVRSKTHTCTHENAHTHLHLEEYLGLRGVMPGYC